MIDMPDFVIVLLIVLGALVALALIVFLVYLLFLIRPSGRAPKDKTLVCDYAHRGLHSDTVPENSLEAFELACRAGYGIELDVQLSRDGKVMVFHDYTLVRMTGVDKKLCELDASELCGLSLKGTGQSIPTFSEVLELIDGRVPILVELKGENFDTSLCPKVAELLSEYKGSYCIESFNPLLVKQMRNLFPDVFCGLLYTNAIKEKKKASVINIAVTLMALNFLCKPNFIAFDEKYRSSFFVKVTTRFYKTPKFVWTVKSQESLDTAHKLGECPIFEGIGSMR